MSERKKYDSTVARIAGNILSGHRELFMVDDQYPLRQMVSRAVRVARMVVECIEETEPEPPQ